MSPHAVYDIQSDTVPHRVRLNDKYVLIAFMSGPVIILDIGQLGTPKQNIFPRVLDSGWLLNLALNGSIVCTAGRDGIVHLWSAESG
jgi:hypothetical protein